MANKMIAFAAIAEQFARGFHNKKRMPGKYLAGHWTSDLSKSLNWIVHTVPRRPKSAELKAPSWSWTSIDGGVDNLSCASPFTQSSVQILEAHTTLTHPSLPYGPVQAGRICLIGKVKGVAYEVIDPNDGFIHLIDCNQYVGWRGYKDFAVDMTELPRPFGDQVWLLETRTHKESDDDEFHHGLILARVSVATEYRRVGSWSVGLWREVEKCRPSFDWIANWHSETITII
jgi:hypothetical protein